MDHDLEKIYAVVARVTRAPAEKLHLDTDLRADLNVDSLQGLQIVAGLEEDLGIEIPDEEIDFYTDIRSILAKVREVRA